MRPRRDASQRYLLAKFSGFESDSSLSYVKLVLFVVGGLSLSKLHVGLRAQSLAGTEENLAQ